MRAASRVIDFAVVVRLFAAVARRECVAIVATHRLDRVGPSRVRADAGAHPTRLPQ
jgi:hypothetical protein